MDGIIKKINLNISFKKITCLIFSLRAIYYVWLAFAYSVYSPLYANLMLIVRYSAVIVGVVYLIMQEKVDKNKMFLLLPVVFYFLMLLAHTYGGYGGNYLDEVICIFCFLMFNKQMKIDIFSCFCKIVIWSSFISIILYILYILNIPIGFKSVPFYSKGELSSTHTEYQKWFIFAIMGTKQYGNLRLCGIFNEPGALGTVCALIFSCTNKTLKIYEKIILLVSVALTLSLAGYLLIMLYFFLYFLRKNRKYSILAILILALFFMLPNINWGNTYLNLFFQRFSITSSGLAGNNRTDQSFNELFESLLNSNDAWFGYGARYTINGDSSTYKTYIIQFGIIGFVSYLFLWLYSSIRSSKLDIDCLIFIFIFFASIYQRPVTMSNTYGYIVMFGGIEFLLNNCKDKLTTDKTKFQRSTN